MTVLVMVVVVLVVVVVVVVDCCLINCSLTLPECGVIVHKCLIAA